MAFAQPSDNVFVTGLPFTWSEAELNTLFGSCGPVTSSVVLVNKATGQPRGAALVRFGDVGAAQYAVQSLNGYVVEGTGRTLEVKFAESPEMKGARKAAKFSMMGAMGGMGGMGGAMRFNPYGMGAGPAAGMMAPQMGGGMGGGRIRVPKRQDVTPEEGANLHVFGLDHNVTDLHLYEAFAGYGAIRSVRAMSDKMTGQPKGFGFVQFFNAQDAHSAIAALNGAQVGTRAWSISIHKKKE